MLGLLFKKHFDQYLCLCVWAAHYLLRPTYALLINYGIIYRILMLKSCKQFIQM